MQPFKDVTSGLIDSCSHPRPQQIVVAIVCLLSLNCRLHISFSPDHFKNVLSILGLKTEMESSLLSSFFICYATRGQILQELPTKLLDTWLRCPLILMPTNRHCWHVTFKHTACHNHSKQATPQTAHNIITKPRELTHRPRHIMHTMCVVILMFIKKVAFCPDPVCDVRCCLLSLCSAVYLLDSRPVCDEAVGVWREGGLLTACWLAGCCRWKHFKPPENAHTHRDMDTHTDKHKHWCTVCRCIVETGMIQLTVCVYRCVYFLSQWLCTYQTVVSIPNLIFISLPLPFCLSLPFLYLFSPQLCLLALSCREGQKSKRGVVFGAYEAVVPRHSERSNIKISPSVQIFVFHSMWNTFLCRYQFYPPPLFFCQVLVRSHNVCRGNVAQHKQTEFPSILQWAF